ncbi:helix-turn-helix domain-containing protein [Sulfuricaulis sp.]|uniref:helix-turn-helix domain-containing protein n=1 Tax=Sulfuricaulis sp. TaxID=2003553 RepID=UPI003C727A84
MILYVALGQHWLCAIIHLIRSKSLAAVAAHVGYDSEAAFNRAFKCEFGMPPAGWRKNRSNKADVAGTAADAIQPMVEKSTTA